MCFSVCSFPTCATGGSQGGGHGFTDGTKGPDGVYYCKVCVVLLLLIFPSCFTGLYLCTSP
jgi:hypothetical protein